MPYVLAVETSLSDSMRAVLKDQLEESIALTESPSDVLTAVHDVRKNMKRIRAGLRLVRPNLLDYAAENARFRDIARGLSPLRDAEALMETLEHHQDSLSAYDASLYGRVAARVRRHREQVLAEQDPLVALQRAGESLRAARPQLDALTIGGEGFGVVAGGLDKTYKRARRLWGRAFELGSFEVFHEWRKRAKYHRHHLELLHEVWPELMGAWTQELAYLTDLLGWDHDLAVLLEIGGDDPALAGWVAERSVRYRDKLDPVARRLFTERRSALVRRLGGYWQAKHVGLQPQR